MMSEQEYGLSLLIQRSLTAKTEAAFVRARDKIIRELELAGWCVNVENEEGGA